MPIKKSMLRLMNKNIVYIEPLKQVLMGGGKISLPCVKTSTGYHVDDSDDTRQKLQSQRESFLTGFMTESDIGPIYIPDTPPQFRQLKIKYGFDLKLYIPSIKDSQGNPDMSQQISTICMMIESHKLFMKYGLVCVPIYVPKLKYWRFELFDTIDHIPRGTCLLHSEQGILKIAVNHDDEEGMYSVKLESKYSFLNK